MTALLRVEPVYHRLGEGDVMYEKGVVIAYRIGKGGHFVGRKKNEIA